jgi:hypothetical protein
MCVRVFVYVCLSLFICVYECVKVYACMGMNMSVGVCLCVFVMRDHVFGISRTINSIVSATVDEKKNIATKTRELFIVSLLMSHFMKKYKRI